MRWRIIKVAYEVVYSMLFTSVDAFAVFSTACHRLVHIMIASSTTQHHMRTARYFAAPRVIETIFPLSESLTTIGATSGNPYAHRAPLEVGQRMP